MKAETKDIEEARVQFERIIRAGTTPLDSMRSRTNQMQEMGDEMLDAARLGLAALNRVENHG